MKESSKILLYGLLASVLLILLCLYTHQDEFIIKEKISTTETAEFMDQEVEKKENISSTLVSKPIEKEEVNADVPNPQEITESLANKKPLVDENTTENQSLKEEDEVLSDDDTNKTVEKLSTVERGPFKDKEHIQLKEHPKVLKVEKTAEISDKNLPIEDNKPLIDNEKSEDKKSQTPKVKKVIKKVAKKSVKKEKSNVSIASIQQKVSSIAKRNISFYKGKAQITSKGKKTLNKLIPLLKKVPHAKIIVKGYTDASGKESVNLWISQERAKSVKRYLGKHGIPVKNIVSKGYGESELLYGDKPYSKLNRRVEIEVKKGK